MAVALVVSGCSFDPNPAESTDDAAPGVGSNVRRKLITIPHAGWTTDLVGFPVPIDTADPDVGAASRIDGNDIQFTTMAGDPIPYERVVFEKGTGALVVWVRVPTLFAAQDTKFYLTYGGGGDTDLQDRAATWSGYTAAWHFDGPSPFLDSALLLDGASPTAPQIPAQIAGAFRFGRDFNGTNNLVVIDNASGALEMGDSSFSISLWVFKTSDAGLYDMAWSKGGFTGGVRGYDLELGSGGWRFDVADGIKLGAAVVPATYNAWVHVAGVADRSTSLLHLYVDGLEPVPSGNPDITNFGSLTDPLAPAVMGTESAIGGGDLYRGAIDELRIIKQALPADWFFAEHASRRQNFLRIGPEEAALRPRP
jgi:hypothetical protein